MKSSSDQRSRTYDDLCQILSFEHTSTTHRVIEQEAIRKITNMYFSGKGDSVYSSPCRGG